jgi:DNA-binding response OmpR family regulator
MTALSARVLVVEDDQLLLESIVEYLTLCGMAVTGADSGLAFYQALATQSFDVAVLDIGLPDQCGYVLAEYVRKNTGMGVIILTARSETEDRVKGYESGADVFMVKPVDTRELQAAIVSLAGRRRPAPFDEPVRVTSAPWQLLRSEWILVDPAGVRIMLTAKEFRLVELLVTTCSKTVSRERVISILDYSAEEYEQRALDSLIRRLRRKIETLTGLPSPIKTVHALGYCFSSVAVIQ